MSDDERLPSELGRYRPRWDEPARGAPEGAPRTMKARDTVLGRDLDLVRLRFGSERREVRDRTVADLRARTTVLSPSLVAVHDAGDWDDDAYVLLEPVELPEPMAAAVARLTPSLAERLRWAVALADVAVVVDDAGLAISAENWAETSVDAYRSPRVPGLERAEAAAEETRAATVRALGSLLSTLSPTGVVDLAERETCRQLEEILRSCEQGTVAIRELRSRLGALTGTPDAERPLFPTIDPESLRRREAGLLLVGIGIFVLSFVVLIAVLASSR